MDMRRRVEAERRATRRSVQIVVGVSVGTALGLAVFNHSYVEPYDGLFGQLILTVVLSLYTVAFLWLRRLARFELPQRFLSVGPGSPGVPAYVPPTVAAWQDDGAGGEGGGGRLRGRHAMDAGGGL
jgi:hypothetical protein